MNAPAICYLIIVSHSSRRLEPTLKIRVELYDKLRHNWFMHLVPNVAEFRVFGETGFTFPHKLKQFISILFSLAALVGKVGEPEDFWDDTKLFCVLPKISQLRTHKNTLLLPQKASTHADERIEYILLPHDGEVRLRARAPGPGLRQVRKAWRASRIAR